MSTMPDHAKTIIDGVSIGTAIATLAGWLPNLAALLSIVWLGMQMYDWISRKLRK